jgi:hypothetical protein
MDRMVRRHMDMGVIFPGQFTGRVDDRARRLEQGSEQRGVDAYHRVDHRNLFGHSEREPRSRRAGCKGRKRPRPALCAWHRPAMWPGLRLPAMPRETGLIPRSVDCSAGCRFECSYRFA